MKRTRIWIVLGGLAAASVGVYFGTQALVAQAPGTPAANRPRSRMAFMNIVKVIKEFKHANQLDNEVKNLSKGYADKITAKRNQLIELQNNLQKDPAATQAQKDNAEKQITAITREIQDLNAEAQKAVNTKQGEVWLQIYREVEAATQQVAVANDLDMILSYPDAASEAEKSSPLTAIGKLRSPALMPIYASPALDITPVIVETLNRTYPVAAAAPGG